VRVLDLGCGSGRDLRGWGLSLSDKITGLDIDRACLSHAKARFCGRLYVQGAGECLPFQDESFERIISSVALPYMDISKALAEACPNPRPRRSSFGEPALTEFYDKRTSAQCTSETDPHHISPIRFR
jgi:SAM-dependent methyltransferase